VGGDQPAREAGARDEVGGRFRYAVARQVG